MKPLYGKRYHTLSFSYVLQNEEDSVYFATLAPYSFSYLQQYLINIQSQIKVQYFKSLAGFEVPYIQTDPKENKKSIFIIGIKPLNSSPTPGRIKRVLDHAGHHGLTLAVQLLHLFLAQKSLQLCFSPHAQRRRRHHRQLQDQSQRQGPQPAIYPQQCHHP